MENEKSKNGIIGVLIGIIVCLVVVIVLFATGVIKLGGSDLNSSKKNEESSTKTEKSIKLDDSKDYVYDADYKYDGQKSSEYKCSIHVFPINDELGLKNINPTDGKCLLSSLKVPYVNLNTDDASKVNEEIKNLYIENAKKIDEVAENNMTTVSIILNYKSFVNNDILSIVVGNAYLSTGNSLEGFDYKTYSFDLKTGKLLSYDDVLSKLGYTRDSVIEKIKTVLSGEAYAQIKGAAEQMGKDYFNSQIDMINDDINQGKLRFFVNESGKLNIFIKDVVGAASKFGYNYHIITLE